jgi:hypothetical protein
VLQVLDITGYKTFKPARRRTAEAGATGDRHLENASDNGKLINEEGAKPANGLTGKGKT